MRKSLGMFLFLLAVLLAAGNNGFRAEAEAAAEKPLTLMVYMCGSNLESEGASASLDLKEMEDAGFNQKQLNVLVLTGGSARWHNGQTPEGTALIEVGNHKSRLLTVSSPEASMGVPGTLTWLIRFARERYPARQYALIIWDHGAGPLGGVCLDENYAPDRLTLDELSQALEAAEVTDRLSWIGFDACLMSTVEVASFLSPWADYLIASQETEPASGWDYSFLKDLADQPDPVQTARRIIDLYIDSVSGTEAPCTLSCTDLSRVSDVAAGMNTYFDALAGRITPEHFAWFSAMRKETVSFGKSIRGTSGQGYDLVDLASLISLYGENSGAKQLESSLSRAVVYHRENREPAGGLSVYHPYQNKEKYLDGWALEYRRLGFCAGYTDYLLRFGDQLLSGESGSWQRLAGMRQEAEDRNGHLFTLQLTPEQQTSFLEAQLVLLRPLENEAAAVFSETADGNPKQWWYSPVAFAESEIDANGLLTARWNERALYAVNGNGVPLAGPLAWRLLEDGRICVQGHYRELTGRENAPEDAEVLFICEELGDGTLRILRKETYDPLTERYTPRLAIREEEYSTLIFDPLASGIPLAADPLPGLDQWRRTFMYSEQIPLSESWTFQFQEEQLSGARLFASFEITDWWQNSVMCPLLSVDNPNLVLIDRDSVDLQDPDVTMTESIMADSSRLNPSILLRLESIHHEPEPLSFEIHNLTVNGDVSVTWYDETREALSDVPSGLSRAGVFRIPAESLRGLREITEISFSLWCTTPRGDLSRFDLSIDGLNCSLAGIAPEAGPVLAGSSLGEIFLNLTELKESPDHSLTAVFHVVNHSETLFSASDWTMAADGIVGNGYATGSVLPGTEGYCIWIFENRSSLSILTLQGNERGKLRLTGERLLQASGVTAVHSIQLLRPEEDSSVTSLNFSLPEALSLKAGSRVGPENELLLLNEEDVQVFAQRILIGTDGAGIRLRAVNRLGRPILLSLGDRMIQGLNASNTEEVSLLLPAHGAAYRCVLLSSLNLLPVHHIVDQLGFSFQWEDRQTSRAVIRLLNPVRISSSGSVYPEAAGLEISPAVLPVDRTESILAQYDSAEITVQLLSLETGLRGELTGSLRLISHMDQDLHTFYSSMMVENTLADAILNRIDLPAGGTQVISFLFENAALDDDGIIQETNVLRLSGYAAISHLTLFLGTNQEGGGGALTVPLTLDTPFPLREAEAPESAEPRLTAEKDGVALLLRSVELGSGYSTSMNMTFEIVNDTDHERYIGLSGVRVSGQLWSAFLHGWVPARSRKIVTACLYAEDERTMPNRFDSLSMYVDLCGDSLWRFPDEPIEGQEMFLVQMTIHGSLLFSRRAGTRLLPDEFDLTSEYLGTIAEESEWW